MATDPASPTPPPPAPPAPPAEPPPSTSRSVQAALAVCLAAVLLLLLVRGYGHQLRTRPTEHVTPALVDLNSADRSQLAQVPNIGPKLAERIEAHRSAKGGFRSVEDLERVEGIGPKIVEKVRPFVTVAGEPATPDAAASNLDPQIRHRNAAAMPSRPSAPPSPPVSRSRGSAKLQPGDPPVNVNTATAEELQQIPSVGPVTAANILAARAERPFRSIDDLDRVRGIGPKTLEKIRPYVKVE
jgi:competence protein ComEA